MHFVVFGELRGREPRNISSLQECRTEKDTRAVVNSKFLMITGQVVTKIDSRSSTDSPGEMMVWFSEEENVMRLVGLWEVVVEMKLKEQTRSSFHPLTAVFLAPSYERQ